MDGSLPGSYVHKIFQGTNIGVGWHVPFSFSPVFGPFLLSLLFLSPPPATAFLLSSFRFLSPSSPTPLFLCVCLPFFPSPLCPHPTARLRTHTVLLNVAAGLRVGRAGALQAVDSLEGLLLGSPSVFN